MGFDQPTEYTVRNHTSNSELLLLMRLTHDWVKVSNSTDLFVYSAFREWNQIRIVGASLLNNPTEKPLFCNIFHLDVEGNTIISTTRARRVIIPENHGRR